MKYSILTFSLLIILCSCNIDKGGKANQMAGHTLIFNETKTSGAKIGEKINQLSAIPLETNPESLIGNIEQLRITNEKVFILDDQNHAILVFDNDGRFLLKISAQGKGPGQYQFLRDFIIDEINNEIIILGSPNKVIRFDMSGGFIDEKSLGFTPLKFVSMNEESYFFWNGVNSVDFAPLIKTDKHFNLIESYFADSEEPITTSNMFTSYNGSYYLRPFFDEHNYIINELSSSGVKAKYQIDFGSNNWPETIEINRESPEREKGYVYGISNFFESKQWITFSFTSKKMYHYAIYQKETQQSDWWAGYIAGTLPETILSSIQFMEEDTFYSIVEPFYVKKYLNAYKENGLEYDYSNISGPLKEIYSLLENVDESDNPLIFTFTLNHADEFPNK